MDELDMDAEGLPDEPLRDWWTFDSDATSLVMVTALGLGSLAITSWALYAALTFRRSR